MNCLGENRGRWAGRAGLGVDLCWTARALGLERGKEAPTLLQPPCASSPSICLVRGGRWQHGGGVTICSQGWETDFNST